MFDAPSIIDMVGICIGAIVAIFSVGTHPHDSGPNRDTILYLEITLLDTTIPNETVSEAAEPTSEHAGTRKCRAVEGECADGVLVSVTVQ